MIDFKTVIDAISLWAIPFIILCVLGFAVIKKVAVYEAFVDGAKDGVKVAVNILPYLVAIIVAISMLRASGAIEMLGGALSGVFGFLKIPPDILPLMIVRSLSGSASLGIFADIATEFGNDAFITKLSAIMVGSSETTFYVLAVYFGAVGIKKFRHALLAGLLADGVGIIAAVIVARFMFLP